MYCILFSKLMQQKRPAGTRQTEGNILVWYGTLEIKSANLTMTTFAYCSPPYLFYGVRIYILPLLYSICAPLSILSSPIEQNRFL
jgi:hypothetical protein